MTDIPPLGDPPPPPPYTPPPPRRLSDEPRHLGGVGYFEKIIGVNDNVGMFAFTGAQWIENINITPDDRCDIGSWGPVTFHGPTVGEDIDSCSCGRVDAGNEWVDALCSGHYVPHMQNKASLQVIPVPPDGFIWYIEYNDSAKEAEFLQCHWNHNARTLQELLKLMFEWRDAHVLLGVNDNIAVTADAILTGLDVPEEIEEWVRDNVPDQFVMRFLNGDTSARERLLPVPELPDSVSQWLWKKVIDAPASLFSFISGGH